MNLRLFQSGTLLVAALSLVSAFTATAHQPPTPKQIAELKAQGLYEKRVAFAESLGNSQLSADLFRSAKRKILRAQLQSQGVSEKDIEKAMSNEPTNKSIPSDRVGIPTTGSPNTLTLLIDFSDVRAPLPASVIRENI